MRRRLVISYGLLLTLVLVALQVPLAVTIASRNSQAVITDRIADASRFSALAEPALRTGKLIGLHAELSRYDQLYGIAAALVDKERRVVVSSRQGVGLAAVDVRLRVDHALAGNQPGDTVTVWPWRSRPLVVATPVGSGGDVIGAIVTISPSQRLDARNRTAWLILATGGLLSLAVCVLAAIALARWTVNPVDRLDVAAHQVAAGRYGVRVPVDTGPPELRRLAHAFNEMVDTVTDALERQRAFAAQASHQLRNPLTALRIRVEELGDAVTTDDGRAEHRLALQEMARLCDVLDGLLALAQAERDGCRTVSVDAAMIAEERIAAWRPLAAQRDITLLGRTPAAAAAAAAAAAQTTETAKAETAPVLARAVVTAIDQALDALIDNALKFAGPGATVTVTVERADDGVVLSVVDDGPGLCPEQRRLAIERFWRAPGVQNTAGSGLGLPIVAALTEASGGRVELLAAPAGGLHARLWFPPG